MKHEWRKKEKSFYLPKALPEIITIPEFQFLTIEGEGNPNQDGFADYISALYAVSYAIKMGLKKEEKPKGYIDYTVYPLEGIWDINEEAKAKYSGKINKDDLVFKLMIRQPDFINESYAQLKIEQTLSSKPDTLIDQVNFEKIADGKCIQMLHIGSYDDEPKTFEAMEEFANGLNLERVSKVHREIYLTDFRKVAPEKLKTTLRFKVKNK